MAECSKSVRAATDAAEEVNATEDALQEADAALASRVVMAVLVPQVEAPALDALALWTASMMVART